MYTNIYAIHIQHVFVDFALAGLGSDRSMDEGRSLPRPESVDLGGREVVGVGGGWGAQGRAGDRVS